MIENEWKGLEMGAGTQKWLGIVKDEWSQLDMGIGTQKQLLGHLNDSK